MKEGGKVSLWQCSQPRRNSFARKYSQGHAKFSNYTQRRFAFHRNTT